MYLSLWALALVFLNVGTITYPCCSASWDSRSLLVAHFHQMQLSTVTHVRLQYSTSCPFVRVSPALYSAQTNAVYLHNQCTIESYDKVCKPVLIKYSHFTDQSIY